MKSRIIPGKQDNMLFCLDVKAGLFVTKDTDYLEAVDLEMSDKGTLEPININKI